MKNRCRRGFHLLLLLGRRLVGRSWNLVSYVNGPRNHRVAAQSKASGSEPEPPPKYWLAVTLIELKSNKAEDTQCSRVVIT